MREACKERKGKALPAKGEPEPLRSLVACADVEESGRTLRLLHEAALILPCEASTLLEAYSYCVFVKRT